VRIRRDEAYESEQLNFLLKTQCSHSTHDVEYEYTEYTKGVEHLLPEHHNKTTKQ